MLQSWIWKGNPIAVNWEYNVEVLSIFTGFPLNTHQIKTCNYRNCLTNTDSTEVNFFRNNSVCPTNDLLLHVSYRLGDLPIAFVTNDCKLESEAQEGFMLGWSWGVKGLQPRRLKKVHRKVELTDNFTVVNRPIPKRWISAYILHYVCFPWTVLKASHVPWAILREGSLSCPFQLTGSWLPWPWPPSILKTSTKASSKLWLTFFQCAHCCLLCSLRRSVVIMGSLT